jgi:hypothetical protein
MFTRASTKEIYAAKRFADAELDGSIKAPVVMPPVLVLVKTLAIVAIETAFPIGDARVGELVGGGVSV